MPINLNKSETLCIDCLKRPPAPQSLCCAGCLKAWRDLFDPHVKNSTDPERSNHAKP